VRSLPGVTLLELLVVLLVIGLVTALAAPALVRPQPADVAESSATRVIDRARAAAVRRGETLALDVSRDGRWTLLVAHADSLPLDSGTLDTREPRVPRRLVLSPLGLCLPDATDDAPGDATAAWDAAACRAAGERP